MCLSATPQDTAELACRAPQAGRYHEAVEKYNDAIDLEPEIPAYYTNRAFCHLKMENHGLAIADATVALELDRTFVKAYYRRGSAFMALAKYKDALRDLKAVRQLKPTDKDALAKVAPSCIVAAHLCPCFYPSPIPSALLRALPPLAGLEVMPPLHHPVQSVRQGGEARGIRARHPLRRARAAVYRRSDRRGRHGGGGFVQGPAHHMAPHA